MSLSHLLLGLLDQPASGYDLKKRFDETLRHLWSAELSQIYPALQRLEDEGHLTSTQRPSTKGPAKRTYRRTAAGRRTLIAWLRADPRLDHQRVSHLAQLCFMAETRSLERTLDFLVALQDLFEERLACYHEIETMWFKSHPGFPDELEPDLFHAHLTVRAGIVRMQANVAWCRECIARVETRARA